jgi:hypothetical protein
VAGASDAPVELTDVQLEGRTVGITSSVPVSSSVPGAPMASGAPVSSSAPGVPMASGAPTASSLAVASGAAGTSGAPIELADVQLEGRTVAVRTEAAGPRWHGLILLHLADGVGIGGQLRIGNAGVRLSLGYLPQLFIIDDDPGDEEFPRFQVASTVQLNVDTFYLFGNSEKGASLDYRYNSLLGHGVGVAYRSNFELSGARFELSVPVIYYPSGSERVRKEYDLAADARVNAPFGAGLDYGIGVAWLF